MPQLLRILVVDDHETVRRHICSLLHGEADFDVLCEADDGIEAVKTAEKLQPDVIVLDISMPGMNGLEAARRIRKLSPSSKIVFLSQHDTIETIREAFRTGGCGYVVKSDAAHDLIPALRAVVQNKPYLNYRFSGGPGGLCKAK
jgi:two-component system, NarL family, response regulator LiaR